MKSKSTAGILGIFFGGVGGHKFYLGEAGTGMVYLLFCWTFIPCIIGLIQGFNLLGMSQAAFDAKYNGGQLALVGIPGNHQQSTNVVVNIPQSHMYGPPPGAAPYAQPALAGGDFAARIGALHDLKVAGALTEAEFTAAKQKLLMASSNS